MTVGWVTVVAILPVTDRIKDVAGSPAKLLVRYANPRIHDVGVDPGSILPVAVRAVDGEVEVINAIEPPRWGG